MRSPDLQIEIRDSVFDPDLEGNKILKKAGNGGGQDLYRVFLYLEGLDVPSVRSVVYHLHSSFEKDKHRIVRTPTNPSCKLVIWTWGLFLVRAEIEDLEGRTLKISHTLGWDRDVKPDLVEAV